MKTLRLYAPIPVLLVWAVVIETVGLGQVAAIVAVVTLMAATVVQVRATWREHRWRR